MAASPQRSLQRSWDTGILVLSAAVIAASALLSPTDEAVYLLGIRLPEICTFRRLTGMSCPGCGLTRSFTYLGHLDIGSAFRMHLLGPVMYVIVAAQVPLRIRSLWRMRQEGLQSGPTA